MKTLQFGGGAFVETAGGLNRYYAGLLQHLPDYGVTSEGLVVGTPAVRAQTNGAMRAVAAADAPVFSRMLAFRQAARSALADRSVLPVAHFALYAFPALDLVARRPFVMHFHGPWALESGVEGASALSVRAKGAIERSVYRHANRFIVLSQAFADVLARTFDVDPARIHIVPGGVSSEYFIDTAPVDARAALGWPAGRPIVLVVRRLASRMGLENLITAATTIRRHVPEALILIAGRGRLAEALEAQIKALDLTSTVRLLGFLPDHLLPMAYRAADYSLVPSMALEGFGLIVAESLAAGTPVLVTPVGGLPEVVAGLGADCVLRDTSADAIAAGVTGALLGELRLPDRARCTAFARERYHWSAVARQVRDIYTEAAA